jgi:hypothetical protein
MEVSEKFQAQAPLLPSILPQQLNSRFTSSYPFEVCNFISSSEWKIHTLLGTN